MARRSISGARVIVTGASSGIGRALALELARQGARLFLTARRADRLEQLTAEIQAMGGQAAFLAGDITESALRRALVDAVQQRWGGLDILVNNAGIGGFGPFAESDEARLRRIMEVNFFAPIELTRVALPLLRQGQRPLVVNIGSVLGHRAVPRKSEYCASKFALHGMSDALRTEWARSGVDVLLISPSTTDSEFFERVLGEDKEAPSSFGRMTPDKVARKVVTAMRQGRHELILSAGGKLLVWLDRLFPTWVDNALSKWA